MNTYYDAMETWVQTELLPQATAVMTIVSGGVFGAVAFLGDLLVGGDRLGLFSGYQGDLRRPGTKDCMRLVHKKACLLDFARCA
ncbi:MAG: hypothetical protein V8R75_06400 [Oscillospiraceae bacterium]